MTEKSLLSDGTYLLRAPEPEDLDVLFNMENDTSLWMVSGNAVPYSRYQIKKYIVQSQHDFYTDRQVRFMIVRLADNVVMGSVDLTDIDPYNGRAEIGIALLSEYRGQGVASATLKIVSEYAKKVLRLRQLFCHVPSDHKQSIKLFASNGFTKTGRLKDWLVNDDTYTDVLILQKFF
ncbi:MAG: GNAT family N-acetyltransferase [Bacteroidaceae bacterium]|nr:GNAT family N-acetyltransferase [Bacteroidaceae bacterium]